MRFAIWTAVSTPGQAEGDKDSLPEQERKCRELGLSRGWVETGVYSAPGASRTKYVNLRDAEKAIPSLGKMLDDAQAGRFDVVILYDYNRLRDLADPVAKTLNSYNVQLFSHNQPVEPMDPTSFNPYAADSESMMRGMNQITQRWQIADLRRKYWMGVNGRMARGIHPSGKAPFGYALTHNAEGRAGPMVVIPSEAQVAVQIKDWYLSGMGVPEIRRRLKEAKAPGKWSDWHVRYMLENPVYCGNVRSGYFKQVSDPRTGKRRLIRTGSARVEKGLHPALWSDETRQRIISEMKRRTRRHKGPDKIQRLSMLLYCVEHERPLRIVYLPETKNGKRVGIRDDEHRGWYCPGVPVHWHYFVRDGEAIQEVLRQCLDHFRNLDMRKAQQETDVLTPAIKELETRRERLTDALEAGTLDAKEYGKRIASLDARLSGLYDKQREQKAGSLDRKSAAALAGQLAQVIEAAPRYFLEADAQEVNAKLRSVIDRIECSVGGIAVRFRG